MQLATNTNLFFNRPDGAKGAIETCIAYAANAGFRRMDLSFLDYINFRFPITGPEYMQWIDMIQETAGQYGVVFSQGHAPFYNFCDENAANKDEQDMLLLRTIDCASILGIPWLAIHAGSDYSADKFREGSKEKNRAYFLPVLEYAAKRNVGIAFENLWDLNIAPKRRYTAMVEDLVDLVDSFDCEYAGICYDVEHAAISGVDPVQDLNVIGSRLKSTHISDFIDIKADHLLPFSGITKWEPIMQKLGKMGYTGDIAFEIHRYTENMPEVLVPSAAKFAFEVGNYLLHLAKQ